MREVGAKIHDFGPFPHVEKTRYVWTGSDNRRKGGEVDEFEGAFGWACILQKSS